MNYCSTINTFYGPVTEVVLLRAQHIKLMICDVDGVMSDGLIYQGENNSELKTFHVRDGYGIRCLLFYGIDVAIITGRYSKILNNRCQTLGITHLYQNQIDKTIAFKMLLDKLFLEKNQVAYIGDDLIDAPIMSQVGLSIAVLNAHPLLKKQADYVTHISGGHGAVREVCDLLLLSQNKLKNTYEIF